MDLGTLITLAWRGFRAALLLAFLCLAWRTDGWYLVAGFALLLAWYFGSELPRQNKKPRQP